MGKTAVFALAALMSLAACVGITEAGARGDGSIDAVERTRSAFGAAADASYDTLEQHRTVLVLGGPADGHLSPAADPRARSLE